MKKYLVIGILIVAIFSSFCLGNQMGKQTQAEAHRQQLQAECVHTLKSSIEWFETYAEKPSESAYWHGVSAFNHFAGTYEVLTLEPPGSVESVYLIEYLNFVDTLQDHPTQCRERMDEIIALIGTLSEDLEDANTYIKFRSIVEDVKDEIQTK